MYRPSEYDDLFEKWDVGTDNSIRTKGSPRDSGYGMIGIEIRSPALYYMPNALKEIGRAVNLLTRTYCISLNDSCGLHCHVGDGLKGFPFWVMQRLMAFLYAFEPQLNSLHWQGRFNHPYAASLRYGSRYSETYLAEHGHRPRPFQGVEHFLFCKDWTELNASCQPGPGLSRLAYRFPDLMHADLADREQMAGEKLTVEFRQHCGSVDSEEIQNWIRTCVGIVRFVKESSFSMLSEMFVLIVGETIDGEDGATREPVLAETTFTILHLLELMGLSEARKYYGRMGKYKIRKGPDVPKSEEQWVREGEQLRVREEMEVLQRAVIQVSPSSSFLFNPLDTTGMPTFRGVAETDPRSEPSPSRDVSADNSSSGAIPRSIQTEAHTTISHNVSSAMQDAMNEFFSRNSPITENRTANPGSDTATEGEGVIGGLQARSDPGKIPIEIALQDAMSDLLFPTPSILPGPTTSNATSGVNLPPLESSLASRTENEANLISDEEIKILGHEIPILELEGEIKKEERDLLEPLKGTLAYYDSFAGPSHYADAAQFFAVDDATGGFRNVFDGTRAVRMYSPEPTSPKTKPDDDGAVEDPNEI